MATFILEFYPGLTLLTLYSRDFRHTLAKWALLFWFISLAFGLKSALIGLRLRMPSRMRSRIYIGTHNLRRWQYHRALVYLLWFFGMDLYGAPNMAQLIFAFRVSVCALFGGLVTTFHAVDTRGWVAIAVDVAVAFGFLLLLRVPSFPVLP